MTLSKRPANLDWSGQFKHGRESAEKRNWVMQPRTGRLTTQSFRSPGPTAERCVGSDVIRGSCGGGGGACAQVLRWVGCPALSLERREKACGRADSASGRELRRSKCSRNLAALAGVGDMASGAAVVRSARLAAYS